MFSQLHAYIYGFLVLALLASGAFGYWQWQEVQTKAAAIAVLDNQVATQKKVIEFNASEQKKLQENLNRLADDYARAETTARTLRSVPAPKVGEKDNGVDNIGKQLEGLTR